MKPAKILISIFSLNLIFTVNACSIYKSEGRKAFESKAPLHIISGTGIKALRNASSAEQLELTSDLPSEIAATELTRDLTSPDCEILSSLELDLRAHSISGTPEVLITQNGSEIWKVRRADGFIQITVIASLQEAQKTGQEKQFSLCQYPFQSEEHWRHQESKFLLDF